MKSRNARYSALCICGAWHVRAAHAAASSKGSAATQLTTGALWGGGVQACRRLKTPLETQPSLRGMVPGCGSPPSVPAPPNPRSNAWSHPLQLFPISTQLVRKPVSPPAAVPFTASLPHRNAVAFQRHRFRVHPRLLSRSFPRSPPPAPRAPSASGRSPHSPPDTARDTPPSRCCCSCSTAGRRWRRWCTTRGPCPDTCNGGGGSRKRHEGGDKIGSTWPLRLEDACGRCGEGVGASADAAHGPCRL
jgi:hypothetical protein